MHVRIKNQTHSVIWTRHCAGNHAGWAVMENPGDTDTDLDLGCRSCRRRWRRRRRGWWRSYPPRWWKPTCYHCAPPPHLQNTKHHHHVLSLRSTSTSTKHHHHALSQHSTSTSTKHHHHVLSLHSTSTSTKHKTSSSHVITAFHLHIYKTLSSCVITALHLHTYKTLSSCVITTSTKHKTSSSRVITALHLHIYKTQNIIITCYHCAPPPHLQNTKHSIVSCKLNISPQSWFPEIGRCHTRRETQGWISYILVKGYGWNHGCPFPLVTLHNTPPKSRSLNVYGMKIVDNR